MIVKWFMNWCKVDVYIDFNTWSSLEQIMQDKV